MNDLKVTHSICITCKTGFEHKPEISGKRLHCSRHCYNKDRRRRTKIQKICVICEGFYFSSKDKITKYCSLKCKHIGIRKHPDRIVDLRKWMLQEDRLKECEKCGYKEYPIILGVHHKNRDHKDNRIENLAVLCANCHSLEHKKHIVHGGNRYNN